MIRNKIIRKWHLVQTLIQFILAICITILNSRYASKNNLKSSLIISLVVLLLTGLQFTLLKTTAKHKKLMQLNFYFECCIIPFTLQTILSGILICIKKSHVLNLDFCIVIAMLYSLIMYLPMTQLALARIKNFWGRILISIIIYFLVLSAPTVFNSSTSNWLTKISNSGILGTISFAIIALFAMKSWGYKLSIFKVNSKVSLIPMILIITFIIYHCSFNGFNESSSWNNFLTSWSFKIPYLKWNFILGGIQAGIGEEFLLRFVILNLSLQLFKTKKNQIVIALFFNALTFGLLHLTNLSTQSFNATIQQALSAATSGIVYAAIYLYTGSLLISIIYHTLFDISGFTTAGTMIMTAPANYDWQLTLFFAIIYFALAYFLISGKRKKVVEDNLRQHGLLAV
ncbi:CPBP family intramembrane metalloprotease [Lactobacillus sp. ESL0684]|uniref:CPBP family intramembrane glutamic endopeptidase n=1 Tax=Lactobacillus sp. ESL0684 TaxID=2983213 RepID=UPI0023F85AC3|nr:CPBP family intramembrane glutamic endopeptidase [Lactobacillus sp. ESL0684]WEV43230.1 CPBP family intramembrane metalloprotease [Lactobacillus sp. ESL0684]